LSADDNISVCTSHDIKNSIPISAVRISAETSQHPPENDTQAKKHKNVRSDPSVCELLNKSDCGCQCGVLTAELEGVKLDMVIMNKNIESKIVEAINAREKDEIACLKKHLDNEREKCERLESDIAILVSGRNKEIFELNKTIVSLENKLKAAEVNNESIDQLSDQLANMQNSIVALEAKLDNPLQKKLTTNENSPENNESKTASPPTQPPLNQLNNVEISIIKPLALGLDENTNQLRVNSQNNQDLNDWLNPALDTRELNKTDKIPHRKKCEIIKEATNIQYNGQGEAIRDADCSLEQSVIRRIKPKPNTKYKGHKTPPNTINSLKQSSNGTSDVTYCGTNNRIEHSDQDQSEKKYKQSLPSKQPHEWLKWLPLLEPLRLNESDEVSYRNKSAIKEATNAQFNDQDETNQHAECSESPNSIQSPNSRTIPYS
jgi:uncharacterized coiled-coil protein SlyX